MPQPHVIDLNGSFSRTADLNSPGKNGSFVRNLPASMLVVERQLSQLLPFATSRQSGRGADIVDGRLVFVSGDSANKSGTWTSHKNRNLGELVHQVGAANCKHSLIMQ